MSNLGCAKSVTFAALKSKPLSRRERICENMSNRAVCRCCTVSSGSIRRFWAMCSWSDGPIRFSADCWRDSEDPGLSGLDLVVPVARRARSTSSRPGEPL